MGNYIDVIIPIPLQKLFTYSISASEANFLEKGMRVAVPFGGAKIYTGIVVDIHQTPPTAYEAKEIHQILDDVPLVSDLQLQFWQWIASYYMCTLGDVMRAALPSAFILESETSIVKNKGVSINESELKDDEFLVFEALQYQSSLKVQDVMGILDKKQVLPIINRLIEKNVVFLEEEVYEKYRPKLVRYVKLNVNYTSEKALQRLFDDLGRAHKQKEVVLTLFSIAAKTKKPVKISDLSTESGVSTSIIKALIDKGVLLEYHIQTDRISYEGGELHETKILNTNQVQALDAIKKAFHKHDVTLLHGVTSSGKTEVYSKLIEDIVKQGRQVLYLLPEIALTTQLIGRLRLYFGEGISV